MKLASTKVIGELIACAHEDLARAEMLWPIVSAQKLLGPVPAAFARKLPTSPTGYETTDNSLEGNSDLTGETVVNARHQIEADDRRAQHELLDALDRLRRHADGLEDAVKRIRTARTSLGRSVPAVDAALNAGLEPTDGQTADELDRKKRGAVEAEASCAACQLGVSEVGRLRKGLCNKDRMRWERAGMPERQTWILQRRAELDAESERNVA